MLTEFKANTPDEMALKEDLTEEFARLKNLFLQRRENVL